MAHLIIYLDKGSNPEFGGVWGLYALQEVVFGMAVMFMIAPRALWWSQETAPHYNARRQQQVPRTRTPWWVEQLQHITNRFGAWILRVARSETRPARPGFIPPRAAGFPHQHRRQDAPLPRARGSQRHTRPEEDDMPPLEPTHQRGATRASLDTGAPISVFMDDLLFHNPRTGEVRIVRDNGQPMGPPPFEVVPGPVTQEGGDAPKN
ncbi:hypothetical protein C8R44DRAFT_895950 [Mycena epipterygia]|nr:hypothetical protein C8R44DRAFT_895950 [Mycena epipterygia]